MSKPATAPTPAYKAGNYVGTILKKVFIPKMEDVIDKDSTITHNELTKAVTKILKNPTPTFDKVQPAFVANIQVPFTPFITSGEACDATAVISATATSDAENLCFDTILCSMGVKYKNVPSRVVRTYMIDCPAEQGTMYSILEEVEQRMLNDIKPGLTGADVYKLMQSLLEKECKAKGVTAPTDHLLPSCGRKIGTSTAPVEADKEFDLNVHCDQKLESGDILFLYVGVNKRPYTSSYKREAYTLLLGDTISLVADKRDDDRYIDIMTKAPHKLGDISYTLNDGKAASSSSDEAPETGGRQTRWASSLRNQRGAKQTAAEERKKRQAAVRQQKSSESREGRRSKLEEKKDYSLAGQLAHGKIFSYSKETEMVKTGNDKKVRIDRERETLLIPLGNKVVPFHFSTIKSLNKQEENDWIYLRINFLGPGVGGAGSYTPASVFPKCTFVKDLTYKLRANAYTTELITEVNKALKRIKEQEQQARESEGIVDQKPLQLDHSADRTTRLKEVYIKPNPKAAGRRTGGDVQAHKNGIRFAYQGGPPVDILYQNVKHAIFLPADNEVIVLVHFYLKQPIMVGKKRTFDVQFYAEVMEEAEKLTSGNMRKSTDEAEMEEELRQRAFIKRLNTEFMNWTEKLPIKFEKPIRRAEFSGTPSSHRSNMTTVRPTDNTLVSLVEGPPFFVLSLGDIELVMFERVVFGQKNFDLIFVLKDYAKPVVRIDVVDMKLLDRLKDWFTDKNLVYFEGRQSLNWQQVLKTVREEDAAGGWEPWGDEGWGAFLDMDRADTDGSGDSDETDSEVDLEDLSDISSDFDDDESESEVSLASEHDSSDGGEDEEEDSGTDWDEMEKDFAERDRKQKMEIPEDEDSDRPGKRRKPNPNPQQRRVQPPAKQPPKPSNLKPVSRPPGARPLQRPPGTGGQRPAPGAAGGQRPAVGGQRPAVSGQRPAPGAARSGIRK